MAISESTIYPDIPNLGFRNVKSFRANKSLVAGIGGPYKLLENKQFQLYAK